MVKFIKPKPLSKREMKDLQRTMSPQIASPLMHTASPIMPFPDSPFLDNHDFNLVESPSGSLNTRQRKQRSVTRKATRDRLLPRARKPGGRHKPIVISSSPSPPRTPIIPSDTDSGNESEFTAMINSAKKRIRQSGDKMREDTLKLQKLTASNTVDSTNLTPSPSLRSVSEEAKTSNPYMSPEQKRRNNLLRKKTSDSPRPSDIPTFAITGSNSSPMLRISFSNTEDVVRISFGTHDDDASQSGTGTPSRTPAPSTSQAEGRLQPKVVLENTSTPNKKDEDTGYMLSFFNFSTQEVTQINTGGLAFPAFMNPGAGPTSKGSEKPKGTKELNAEGTENHGSVKKKPKSRKKKKKRAKSVVPPVCETPAITESSLLAVEQEPSSAASAKPASPTIPPSKQAVAGSRASSPIPEAENPGEALSEKSTTSPSSVPDTPDRNRIPSSTPQPVTEEPKPRRPPPTKEEVKKVIEGLRAVKAGTANGLPQSKSSILGPYMTAMETYRRIFDSTEAGGLALASSQSGKLADLLLSYANSGGAREGDVDGKSKRPSGVAGQSKAAQKPSNMSDGQRSKVCPGGATHKPLATVVDEPAQSMPDIDMEAGGGEFSMKEEDAEEGLMVRDKRGPLMRKVVSFVHTVTTAFLSPWRVLARAMEGTCCV